MFRRRFLFLLWLSAGVAFAQGGEAEIEAIGKVLDDFHDAAAHADADRYLRHMTEDGVFLGTDEWERWPKNPQFTAYVGERFKSGVGWQYRPAERQIVLAESADVAWFDEVISSDANGRFRGTGVLVRQDEQWKIAHYAMSFLVYNEDWQKVIELTRKTAAAKQENPTPR